MRVIKGNDLSKVIKPGSIIVFDEFQTPNQHWRGGHYLGEILDTPLTIRSINSNIEYEYDRWNNTKICYWDNVVWVDNPWIKGQVLPFSLTWDIKQYKII